MRALKMLVLTALFATGAQADGEKAGVFDYYVMALSWSPNWCALEGDARSSPQCHPREDFGWVLHGLWPQFDRGWPAFCPTTEPQPTRRMTEDMADIMGTSGLAWYQWKKHGVCSGLSARGYYDLSRRAYAAVRIPQAFHKLEKAVKLPASLIEEAFVAANPGLQPDMLTVTCKAGYIQEVRLCLSKTLTPVTCGRDVIRDCTLTGARFDPVR
jgi:ribonuclease T2